ncbi:MAG: diacylglycerol kinase family protein [Balneolaceae bacterium]|nr:diacylglycerol kinase family protein [Balneolaceae bacterium]
MQDSYCFIVNTQADRGRTGERFRRNLDQVTSLPRGAEIIYIREQQKIAEEAAKTAGEYRYIVAAGGDGTVQQVARGVVGSGSALGILPLGSGNDFAKSVGMSTSFVQNLAILSEKNIKTVDVLTFDDSYVLNTYGLGVDGLTNLYATQSRFRPGFLRYFTGALRALIQSRVFSYHAEIDGNIQHGKAWMIVAANGATEGGRYEISPGSNVTDGVAELVIVKDVSRWRLLLEFIKLSMGMSFDVSIVKKVKWQSGVTVKLDCEVWSHADGEVVAPRRTFRFGIEKSRLPVITA